MSQIVDWLEINRNKNRLYIILGMLAVLIVIGICWSLAPSKSFVVTIDKEQVAVIDNQEVYTEALETVKTLVSQEKGLKIKDVANNVVVEEVKNLKDKPINKEELVEILKAKLGWIAEATAININGETKLFVASQEQGEEVLNKLKEEFTVNKEEAEVLAIDFEEEVTLSSAEVKTDELIDPGKAVSLIINGTDKIETYQVKKGDTLWDIAYGNNMTVTELKEANPQLKNDVLSIGQELKLVKTEPMVNVVTTVQLTKEENIPFDTKYISDSNLWRGQTTVKENGKSGKQIVTYKIVEKNGIELAKEILNKQVLEEPKTKVVYQGTKMMVASRGGGNGQLAWPLRGTINSPYGSRRSGFHTGLDIDGNTGDPVFAAGSGTVIKAGWSGNYGYCIDIDHGDGLLTRYAHLSKIDVKMGQKVSRGDLIGKVGSTGRSTGSHLHFEVRVNGSHTNPRRYLD
ncbi:MAG: peptidoglycan DD-metalloendopeptidase family protein [Peptococcales bacterium]|jgi:murein DD-endopeptidase MepM/ murein hydrolase activator NlpD